MKKLSVVSKQKAEGSGQLLTTDNFTIIRLSLFTAKKEKVIIQDLTLICFLIKVNLA